MSPTTTPLPIPPIFAKYQQPTRSVRRRSTASGRTRSSEVSGSRDRLRALDALKRASAPRKFDPLGDEHEQAQAALYDLDHPLNKEIMEDVARALVLQQRVRDRKAALQALPKIQTDCSGLESPSSSSASASPVFGRGRSCSSASSSSGTNQVAFQSFSSENEDPVSTPALPRRSKSSQWLRRITSKASNRDVDESDYSDEPSSPAKRLAPLSRFNPFIRARSESLSSITENSTPVPSPRRRTTTIVGPSSEA